MLVRFEGREADGPMRTDREWLLKRNQAMSVRQLSAFYLSLVVVSSLIAIGLALMGAWMVMPFCGIDLLALGLALVVMARRAGDFERISLKGSDLIVEVVASGRTSVTPLNRYWVRLETEDGMRHRVVLAQHGRRLAVGRFVGDAERRQFGQELRSALAEGQARRS
jgi:uncharacterized membrane protein